MSVPRAKTITTYFYPVGDDFRTVVEEWIIFLQPYLDSRRHTTRPHTKPCTNSNVQGLDVSCDSPAKCDGVKSENNWNVRASG
jgi:hypothetical protein